MVEEFDQPKANQYDLFKMTSYYYLCEVADGFGQQNLDDYESEYGFTPEWVSVQYAIQTNRSLLQNPPPTLQRWVKRELFILETISNLVAH